MADRTELDYQQMEQIIRLFQKEEADIRKLLQGMNQRADQLSSESWSGRGSQKFHQEMEGLVLPALNRLVHALDQAGNVSRQIVQTYRQAEEEAGNSFKNLNVD